MIKKRKYCIVVVVSIRNIINILAEVKTGSRFDKIYAKIVFNRFPKRSVFGIMKP